MCRNEIVGSVFTLILSCVVEGTIVHLATNERLYTYPKVGEYKYVAQISSKAGFCTATIINKDWVLTAAHCLYFREKPIGDKDARIIAGVINYERPSRETKHETMSIKIVVHPKFWYNVPSKYDVALVQVRDSFEFGQYMDKIAVSGEEWPQDNRTLSCFTLGYGGFYSTAPTTTVLKRLDRTVTHSETACPCAKRFQWKRIACVVEEGANLMCKGDDGGPLVCGDVVRGIAHMVWNRGNCGGVQYPLAKCVGTPDKGLSVYMFLCPVNDWLNSVVPDIPRKPASCLQPPTVYSSRRLLVLVLLNLMVFY